MTSPPPVDLIEYYVRFVDKRTGRSGVFEAAYETASEAAFQFADDDDAVSAMKVAISADGRPVAMSDATDEVREALLDLIRDGRFETCPHPMVEDVFDEVIAEMERDARDEADHIRTEQAMLQI